MKQDYETILDDTGRKFLNCIEQAGSKMNTVTRDLLEQSTREPSNPNRDPVNPRPILLKIRSELKPRLEARGVILKLPAAPPLIECEATQLAQIFSHLIDRALQHLGARERPQIIVEIYPSTDQKIIAVRVDDQKNDRGIDREFDSNIEPGNDREGHGPIGDNAMWNARRERVDAGTYSGGVDSLAIVKEIADEHGGRVWFDRAPGEGIAFHVSLRTTRR
jgi:signal transduction histidine kinase